MKPPIAYYGGKSSIADQIAAVLPDHRHYVEPYCGSLSVLLAKQPSRMETVNDLDGDLVTFWRVLRDRPDELARAAALTPHARSEHAGSYVDSPDELEQARRVWVRLTQGRSGLQRRTGWRHYVDPNGTSISMPDYLAAYVDRFAPTAERLSSVSLECMDALDLIAKYGAYEDTLLYVDPPYLGSTRGWGNNYRHEFREPRQHRTLAEALRAARAAVVLSGYASSLYDVELYTDWARVEIASGTGNGVDRERTEVLWSNRPFEIDHQAALFEAGAA